jgi:hypothetical protein
MSYPLTVELPEELRQPLFRQATTVGQTPEEWVVTTLRRQLGVRDERLRKHFGAVNRGIPTGADNASIDAYLARAYAETHEVE